jgi:hypothetical protein
MSKRNHNWSHELAIFEASMNHRRTFQLTSPGVAQVTRVRILNAFDTNVALRTVGSDLIFEK